MPIDKRYFWIDNQKFSLYLHFFSIDYEHDSDTKKFAGTSGKLYGSK